MNKDFVVLMQIHFDVVDVEHEVEGVRQLKVEGVRQLKVEDVRQLKMEEQLDDQGVVDD